MRKWLDFQRINMFLYAPFLMAFGAGLYFALPSEPDFVIPVIVCLLLFAICSIYRKSLIMRAITLFVFGFCYSLSYTHILNTPQMAHDLHDYAIVGRVTSIDYTPDKTRIYLSVPATDINAGSGRANIRISIDSGDGMPGVGDMVSGVFNLFSPSGAHAPETFDWARWAYFNGLTATGYASDLSVMQTYEHTDINTIRDYVHKKSNSFLIDSLILGYKHAVPETDSATWLSTGIGHVWSISGFHMTLVGGWLFMLFYFVCRSIPYITRRIPARIPALCISWIGLILYLFISGCDVATMRALIMTTLVFGAFILLRGGISLRNVALAFCVLFLMNPYYVMHAGFQLSFAAVFGLVWMFSVVRPRMPRNRIGKVLYASVITSVTATIFTAPFIAIHFGTFPIYSLLGNLILLPIFSFIIMPLVLIGSVACVFDIHIFTQWAHTVYDATLRIAEIISQLPFAMVTVPHIPNISVIIFIIGFMCLVLLRFTRRYINAILFILICVVGITVAYTRPRPLFYSAPDNELVGFVNESGALEFNKSRSSGHYFTFDTWRQINGEPANITNRRRKHKNGVYRYDTENFNLVYIQKFVPLMKNISALCTDDSIDYIVSYWDINTDTCSDKILHDGFVIYPDGTVRHTPSHRPWHQ